MIIYTALCSFTANIEGSHRQFQEGDVYETAVTNIELDTYVGYKFVKREEKEIAKEKETTTKK